MLQSDKIGLSRDNTVAEQKMSPKRISIRTGGMNNSKVLQLLKLK